MVYANIIRMHTTGGGSGASKNYFYQLATNLPFELIKAHPLNNESLEEAGEHYPSETQWLACWGVEDPLPGITSSSFANGPVKVTFEIVSSRYYKTMAHYYLENFRNITVQKLQLCD